MGLHMGQCCRRWMSFFQNGQLCISISCCHLGPNTFFWISGLLIPMGQLQSRVGQKTQVTIRKRSTVILCGREQDCCKSHSALKFTSTGSTSVMEIYRQTTEWPVCGLCYPSRHGRTSSPSQVVFRFADPCHGAERLPRSRSAE